MNPKSLNPKYNCSIKTRFTHRFLRTLKQVNTRYLTRSTSSSSRDMCRRSLEIKHAANMCMAAAVGSKRAWSRAMLSKICRRRRLHAQMRRRSVHKFNKENINGNPKKINCGEEDNINIGGEGETQQLREIVPGGEDLDMKSLLDETAHYIKCLTTQVQVMKDILHLYSS